jgi:hypothetical protein
MCNTLLYKNWNNLYQLTQNVAYTTFGLNYLSKKLNFKTINDPIVLNTRNIISFPTSIPKTTSFNFVSVKLHINGSYENHFNILIINYALKTIEIFEPHGYNNNIDPENSIALLLQRKFNETLPGFVFIPNFSISNSLQVLHEDQQGLCQTYGLFYLYKRLTNLSIVDPIHFQNMLINTTNYNDIKNFTIDILCQLYKKLDKSNRILLLNYNKLTINDKIILLHYLIS